MRQLSNLALGIEILREFDEYSALRRKAQFYSDKIQNTLRAINGARMREATARCETVDSQRAVEEAFQTLSKELQRIRAEVQTIISGAPEEFATTTKSDLDQINKVLSRGMSGLCRLRPVGVSNFGFGIDFGKMFCQLLKCL